MIPMIVRDAASVQTKDYELRIFDSSGLFISPFVHFKVFDSSRILIIRGGILRPMQDFPESLSQAILVGIFGGAGFMGT